eukprot:g1082.t2
MHVSIDIDTSGVALLTINNPPMNILHPNVLIQLYNHLTQCHENPNIKGVLITGASGKFSAGFDATIFRDQADVVSSSGKLCLKAFRLLETGSKPTVAVIDGVCLGGGCEIAIACNSRICTPGSKLGLPELQLGIIPGFGGTQRLPRLVGLKKSLEMMLTSKPLSATEAQSHGLVEAVVSPQEILSSAKEVVLDIAGGRRPRLATLERTDHLEGFPEALQIFEFAHSQASRQAPGLQHPHYCIEAVKAGVEHGGEQGLVHEQKLFEKCRTLDTHKALVHVFFSTRSTKRVTGVTDLGLVPRAIKSAGVIGGGLMGSGIATALVLADIPVLLKEINQQFLNSGLDRIKNNLQSQARKGKLPMEAANKAFSLVRGVLDYQQFNSVDLVIEAALEDISLKQKIFSELERVCKKDCILATNTSTIDLELVGNSTTAADRIVGAHFFSPAHLMPLLEIVRSKHTSKQVLIDTLALSSRIKKTPVLVGNCTGFAVNRVFFPYTMAACLLVDLGLDPYHIDGVISQKFGMPYGPFRLSDLVGADIGLHVGKNFSDCFPERVYKTQLLTLMNKLNRLGEKTGVGFYKFQKNRKAIPDPELGSILEDSRSSARLRRSSMKLTDQDIIEFIFFPVLNEVR